MRVSVGGLPLTDLRCLSLHQPLPYLAGVVVGDGWLTARTLGLRVADEEFARSFQTSIRETFGVEAVCRTDERGYWLVRTSNRTGRFDSLRSFAPHSDQECRSWLRGMFDSEGNAQCLHRPSISAAAYQRRVAFYSTNEATIACLRRCLMTLGFSHIRHEVTPSLGHLGSKQVVEIRLAGSVVAYSRFAEEIGSSITRKQVALDQIPLSYQPPGHHARAQKQGVLVRRSRLDAGGRY